MAIEIGDVVRGVTNINMPDEVDAVNVWDWVRTDSDSGTLSESAASAAIATKLTDIYGEIIPLLSNLITVVSVTNYKMGYDAGAWGVDILMGTEPIGLVGTEVAELLPHGIAGLLTLPTAYSRRFGRKFIPGLTEGDLVDGIFNGDVVTALLAMGTEFLSAISIDAQYELSPRLLTQEGNRRAFTGAAASGTPSYQRRRKPGVGS